MKKITLLVASMFFASSAFAANFEGLSVFGKAGVSSSNVDVDYSDVGGDSGSSDGFGRSDYFGAIGVDYGFKISDKFVALIGTEMNVNDTDVYKARAVSGLDSEKVNFKQKNSYGVYLAPGYMVNDSTLLYTKFSYNRAKFSAKFTEVNNGTSESGTLSDTFGGFGFGVGARMFVANNVYLNAEWQKIAYDSEKFVDSDGTSKFKPESTVGTIGIGFNF